MNVQRVRCDIQGISPVYSRVEEFGDDFMTFFKSNFGIHITRESEDGLELEFDMVGIDAPLANALRRIMLAEIPSVAIEHVFIQKNTSIIQDEVLAHRLGQVPLRVDPRDLDYIAEGEEATDLNTVVFKIKSVGLPQPRVASETAALEGEEDAEAKYTKVYSGGIEWVSAGSQEERFKVPAGPVQDDILLAKLGVGQEIDVELHAVKGIGKDHAKFSPVATAAYRLLPSITIKQDFVGTEAEELVARCPLNVFDIEDMGSSSSSSNSKSSGSSSSSNSSGSKRAVVARPRDCTVCRECIREPSWADRIAIERVTDHFIFSIESTGALPARQLFKEALTVLIAKAKKIQSKLDEAMSLPGDGAYLTGAAAKKVIVPTMRVEPDDLA